MFVKQESPPTVQIPSNDFSILNGGTAEPGTTMYTVGMTNAIREIKGAVELARAQNQPQVSIVYNRCYFSDNDARQQYGELVETVLKQVEAEIDLTNIQVNYHIATQRNRSAVITIWIS